MFTRISLLFLLCPLVAEWGWSDAAVTRSHLAPAPIIHVLSVEEQLVKEATAQGLPPHIALNVAWEESRFQEHIVSKTHDYGVMQLNRYYYPAAPGMTTEENIRAGVSLLAKYWKQTHSEKLTAMAYRRGPGALHNV
jgi:soluble lytic murein transglycosylase-like protein